MEATMANFFQDVIKRDQRFNSTKVIADLNLLEPVTRQLVQNIITDAAAHGVTYMVFERFRSQVRQSALFDDHATQLKNVGFTIMVLHVTSSKMLVVSLPGKAISPSLDNLH